MTTKKEIINYIKDKKGYVIKDKYILIYPKKILNSLCLSKVLIGLENHGFKFIQLNGIIKAVGVIK